jgi:hypothetical protein
LLLLNY